MKAGEYRDDGFTIGDIVKVEGKGDRLYTLRNRFQQRTADAWYVRDEEERHHVFLTSQLVFT